MNIPFFCKFSTERFKCGLLLGEKNASICRHLDFQIDVQQIFSVKPLDNIARTA